jgi:hypothetical protein
MLAKKMLGVGSPVALAEFFLMTTDHFEEEDAAGLQRADMERRAS